MSAREGCASFGLPSDVRPNAVCGTLDAIEAKFGIPVIYASTAQDLATERAANWLSKHFTYWWLEQHGLGRVLIDADDCDNPSVNVHGRRCRWSPWRARS